MCEPPRKKPFCKRRILLREIAESSSDDSGDEPRSERIPPCSTQPGLPEIPAGDLPRIEAPYARLDWLPEEDLVRIYAYICIIIVKV